MYIKVTRKHYISLAQNSLFVSVRYLFLVEIPHIKEGKTS